LGTRVIGIGNPLRGDDGVGPEVIARIDSGFRPDGVETIDAGEAGLGLVGLMEDASRVVLVDAAEMGLPPGEFRVFGLDEVLLSEDTSGCSIHSARAGTAVKMASALGCLPDEVTVVGVQPREMGWGTGLSPEVASAVPRVVKAVLDNLGS